MSIAPFFSVGEYGDHLLYTQIFASGPGKSPRKLIGGMSGTFEKLAKR